MLGSKSPRRREVLAALEIPFTTVDIECDETYPATLQGADIPLYIAKEKAAAYRCKLQPDELLLTADTIVWLDGCVLGKPHDAADACLMLQRLSGRTHQVFTGVCLTTVDSQTAFADATDVTFGHLSDNEIEHYVAAFNPLDKAGAYGVQEWIGYIGCKSINGSYFNVMGLPVHLVYKTLVSLGYLE